MVVGITHGICNIAKIFGSLLRDLLAIMGLLLQRGRSILSKTITWVLLLYCESLSDVKVMSKYPTNLTVGGDVGLIIYFVNMPIDWLGQYK